MYEYVRAEGEYLTLDRVCLLRVHEVGLRGRCGQGDRLARGMLAGAGAGRRGPRRRAEPRALLLLLHVARARHVMLAVVRAQREVLEEVEVVEAACVAEVEVAREQVELELRERHAERREHRTRAARLHVREATRVQPLERLLHVLPRRRDLRK